MQTGERERQKVPHELHGKIAAPLGSRHHEVGCMDMNMYRKTVCSASHTQPMHEFNVHLSTGTDIYVQMCTQAVNWTCRLSLTCGTTKTLTVRLLDELQENIGSCENETEQVQKHLNCQCEHFHTVTLLTWARNLFQQKSLKSPGTYIMSRADILAQERSRPWAGQH